MQAPTSRLVQAINLGLQKFVPCLLYTQMLKISETTAGTIKFGSFGISSIKCCHTYILIISVPTILSQS